MNMAFDRAFHGEGRTRMRPGLRLLRRPNESIRPCEPRPARRDCHGRLTEQCAALIGADAALVDAAMSPWCSATFTGARHVVRFSVDSLCDADALSARLADQDWGIAGHIVADCAIEADTVNAAGQRVLTIGLLTVEDW